MSTAGQQRLEEPDPRGAGVISGGKLPNMGTEHLI